MVTALFISVTMWVYLYLYLMRVYLYRFMHFMAYNLTWGGLKKWQKWGTLMGSIAFWPLNDKFMVICSTFKLLLLLWEIFFVFHLFIHSPHQTSSQPMSGWYCNNMLSNICTSIIRIIRYDNRIQLFTLFVLIIIIIVYFCMLYKCSFILYYLRMIYYITEKG